MNVSESQTETALVYRQRRSLAEGSSDERVDGDDTETDRVGDVLDTQSARDQRQLSRAARSPFGQDPSNARRESRRSGGRHSAQQARTAGHTRDAGSDSSFNFGETRTDDTPSPPSSADARGRFASPTNDRSRRARDRVDDLDIQLTDQSMQLNADVDRLVDVLYRKLERKRRIERQRRGF